MKKYLLYALVVPLFSSCGENNSQLEKQGKSSVSNLDPKDNLNVQFSSFSEIDSSGVLIFPLSMGESERDGGRVSYKDMPNDEYWNIIFYNSKTEEYHLLSERKMLIVNYDYKYANNRNETSILNENLIFYLVRTDDFNKDKKLTFLDPQYLFISDKFGNNFRQISPSGYNLSSWEWIKSSNKVILTLVKDSDNNLKFDKEDEIATFSIELGKEDEAKEVFDNDFKTKLKILFDRDWKQIKK